MVCADAVEKRSLEIEMEDTYCGKNQEAKLEERGKRRWIKDGVSEKQQDGALPWTMAIREIHGSTILLRLAPESPSH